MDSHVKLTDGRNRIHQLFDETKWHYIWLLLGSGVLLFLALFILCVKLWLLLRSCHRVT
jgi:hypothetical protein